MHSVSHPRQRLVRAGLSFDLSSSPRCDRVPRRRNMARSGHLLVIHERPPTDARDDQKPIARRSDPAFRGRLPLLPCRPRGPQRLRRAAGYLRAADAILIDESTRRWGRTPRSASVVTAERSRRVSRHPRSTSSSSQHRRTRLRDTGSSHSDGSLPVGAPLPCYECHNPHGSERGNGSLISDALGAGLDTSTTAGVRTFCFTCHTTSDTLSGWSSQTATYTAVSATDTVVGLRRDGGVGGGANVLHLPTTVAAHAQGDAVSCYDCHGNSYAPGGQQRPRSRRPATTLRSPTRVRRWLRRSRSAAQTTCRCAPIATATELGAEHSKASASSAAAGCAACHPTPRDTLAPWDKTTCAQGGCHTPLVRRSDAL